MEPRSRRHYPNGTPAARSPPPLSLSLLARNRQPPCAEILTTRRLASYSLYAARALTVTTKKASSPIFVRGCCNLAENGILIGESAVYLPLNYVGISALQAGRECSWCAGCDFGVDFRVWKSRQRGAVVMTVRVKKLIPESTVLCKTKRRLISICVFFYETATWRLDKDRLLTLNTWIPECYILEIHHSNIFFNENQIYLLKAKCP